MVEQKPESCSFCLPAGQFGHDRCWSSATVSQVNRWISKQVKSYGNESKADHLLAWWLVLVVVVAVPFVSATQLTNSFIQTNCGRALFVFDIIWIEIWESNVDRDGQKSCKSVAWPSLHDEQQQQLKQQVQQTQQEASNSGNWRIIEPLIATSCRLLVVCLTNHTNPRLPIAVSKPDSKIFVGLFFGTIR